MLTALAATVLIAGCAAPGPWRWFRGEPPTVLDPGPPPENPSKWVDWLDDQPGVTTLDDGPRLPWERAEVRAVRVDDAEAAVALAETLEALDAGTAPVVAMVLDIDGARSELRYVAGATPAESLEALASPMPTGATLRAIGYPAESWVADYVGPVPLESVSDVRYFADTLLPTALEVTAPEGYTVSVSTGEFGEGGDHVQQLGGNIDEQNWETAWPEFRALADGLEVAMELEQPPVDVSHDVIRFRQRAAAVAAAQQLEDTPFTISTVRGNHAFYLYPEREWEASSPTRDELIAFADANEDAHIETIGGVEVEYTDVDACDGFLDDLPAWTGSISLVCPTDGGGFFRVRDDLARLPQTVEELAPVIGGSGGVHWYPDQPKVAIWEGGDLEAQIRAFRALGWTGEAEVRLRGLARTSPDGRAATIEFRSTPTGKATDVDGSQAGQRGELVALWDSTATG